MKVSLQMEAYEARGPATVRDASAGGLCAWRRQTLSKNGFRHLGGTTSVPEGLKP
jgi:hypothetical protein